MATIVVDELITKLDYQHDDATLKRAEQAVKALDTQNKATAESADKLSAENRKLAEQTDALTRAQNDLANQIANATTKTDQLVEEQRRLRNAAKEAGQATDDQERRLAELDREIAESRKHTRSLREESARLGREKQKVSLESRKLSRAQSDVSKQSRRAADDQRKLKDAMRSATERAREESGALTKLAERIQGVAGGQLAADAVRAVGAGIVELGRNVIETGSTFESLRARLQTVEGSSEGAARAFSQIQEFATQTPFQLEEVTTAFVRLKAFGLDASQKSMTSFGDIAATSGKSIVDFVDAIAGATTGEFERLKAFNIKASKEGEKITFSFKGQQKVVKNTAQEIQKYLIGIGQSTGVAGAMADQMKTTAGAISNFKDTIARTFDQIAQQGPLESFNALLKTLADAIGGNDGLGKVIADVLVIALDTLRKLFEGLPSDTLTEFLQALVDLVRFLIDILLEAVAEGAGILEFMFEFATTILEAVNSLMELREAFSGAKEKLDEIPGPLDLILKAIKLLLIPIEFFAELLSRVVEAAGPFLDRMAQFIDSLPSLGSLFSSLGSSALSFAEDLGILSRDLQQTANFADIAAASFQNLSDSADFKTKTDAELQALVNQGNALAVAEVQRRVGERESGEKQVEAAKKRQEKIKATADKADKLLQNPDRLTRDQLTAMTQDFGLTEKQRTKAQKEIDKRDKKSRKAGQKAADKERKSLLTADIEKQIDELAKAAGRRAAARAQLRAAERNQPLSAEERNQIELAERKAVSERLTTRFTETGQLPPGLATDLVQAAALPNIEEAGGRLAPPVITVNNTRVEVTGNTFEARVTVEGGMSASPQSVAQAVVTRAQPVTFQEMATAIQNQLTNER